jgi:hypothetical protein
MSEEERTEGLGELRNGLEALVNLLYLIREDRKYSARVLQWVEMADVRPSVWRKSLVKGLH